MFAQKVFAPITTGIMQHVKEKIYQRESMRPTKMLTKDYPTDLVMNRPESYYGYLQVQPNRTDSAVSQPLNFSDSCDQYFMNITTSGFCIV